jgi:hypothetical protein
MGYGFHMNQRQKTIAAVLAIPVIGLILYAAIPSHPHKAKGKPAASANVAAKNKAANFKNMTLKDAQAAISKKWEKVQKLTKEDYADMRKRQKNLPGNLATFQRNVKKRYDKIMGIKSEEEWAKIVERSRKMRAAKDAEAPVAAPVATGTAVVAPPAEVAK